MKKLCLFIASLFALVLAQSTLGSGLQGSVPQHNHSSASTGGGTLAVSGTLSSTKACAATFTRVTPNYCRKTNVTNLAAIASNTACTAFSPASALPSDAKLLVISLLWVVKSNNGSGISRQNGMTFYGDASCTAGQEVGRSSMTVYEQAAIAAGQTLGAAYTTTLILPPESTNTFRYKTDNAGGNGNADVSAHQILGYFD